jgi:2-haloacid dehalogenase
MSLCTSIHAIIFDFGGVLINWDPHRLFDKYFNGNPEAVDAFMDEIGFSSWNLSQDKGYPFTQAVMDLSVAFPQYAHLIRAYDVEWEESITGILPETVDILARLKTTGIRLFGLTNWSAEKFSLIRRKFHFFDLFEDIVVSGEVKLIKPEPEIFLFFLQKNHLRPEECLMIDDSPGNIESARKLGFCTHLFTSPTRLELELGLLGLLPS